MEKVGFWCLVLIAYSSAAPRAPQEEKSGQNKTLEAELEDQGNVWIEVRNNAIHYSVIFPRNECMID